MALNFRDLTQETRRCMLLELEEDVAGEKVYYSNRLNDYGREQWVTLLRDAFSQHNDEWLANEIRRLDLLNSFERNGTRRMARNAPDQLAEGEFNRFFIRGLCLRALSENKAYVEVYRARHSDNPRPESEEKIGLHVSPDALLRDLRENIGFDTYLGLPAINSGLSAFLP